MTNAPTALGALVAYVGITLLSIPLALVAYLLAPRFESFAAALGRVAKAVVALVALTLVVAAVAISPVAAAWLGAAFLAGVVVLVGFPLFIGRRLVARWTGCSLDEGLEFATLGLPTALFVSMLVFLVPGGPARYNITVLGGAAAVLAWSAFVLVVSVGPAVGGVALYRLFERL